MKHETHQLSLNPPGRGFYEIADTVRERVKQTGMHSGLLTLFVQHTSASLLIQENYDIEVQRDLERFLARLVPDGDPLFHHTLEGHDDMPAHIRAALTQSHLAIPVIQGALVLGTWQGIYLYEHRLHGQSRNILLYVIGE